MKNVLIEFFDNDYLENIIASVDGDFDEAVFFYESQNEELVKESRGFLKMFLKQKRKMNVEFRMIAPFDYQSVISSFKQLRSEDTNYVFDTTGGSNFFIAAAGYFTAHYPQENEIRIYDINQRICYSDREDQKCRKITLPKLKVEEVVKIHNASVIKEPRSLIRRNISNHDLEELKKLWKLASADTAEWNRFMQSERTMFPATKAGEKDVVKIVDTVSKRNLKSHNALIGRLQDNGFVKLIQKKPSEKKSSATEVTYELFLSENISAAFKKAGNVLELYTYAAMKRSSCFDDVATGINLDWDTETNKSNEETTNEIDVIATAGCIPVVISCKNTTIIKEYLYELETVANHYCGKYSRKVIITSAKASPAVRNRAKDMGITVIDNSAKIEFETFRRRLEKVGSLS